MSGSCCLSDSVVLTAISFKVAVLEMMKRRQLFLIKVITWKDLNGSMILDVGVSDMSCFFYGSHPVVYCSNIIIYSSQ